MHLIIDCTTTQNQLKFNGIGKYTKNVVRRLIEKDIDITLLLFDGESTLDPYLNEKNVNKYRLGKVRDSDYKNILTYLFKILPAIRKVRKEDSIYFCPYFWIGIPSLHIPTVLMVHDMILPIFNIYSEKGFVQNIIKRILYWLELYKARYCKAIITNSECTKNDFQKYFPKYPKQNIYSIYLDRETEEGNIRGWDKNLPKDYKQRGYFIYLGGTPAKNKNTDGIVKGYRDFLGKLDSDIKPPYLVIAGKNFTKDSDINVIRLRDKIKCLGLKDNIIFTGFYEDTHTKLLLQNSLAFVHLSLYEGFGIALVEAMKYGAPVIAHNGSCYPEVLGDAGILVNGLNSTEVGSSFYKIYIDEDLREDLVEMGKKQAEIFSWETTVEKTLKVLKKI